MTKTAGIAIDDWKLEIFRQHLTEAGYEFTKHPGLTKGTTLLKVKTDSVAALKEVVEAAQLECREKKQS